MTTDDIDDFDYGPYEDGDSEADGLCPILEEIEPVEDPEQPDRSRL